MFKKAKKKKDRESISRDRRNSGEISVLKAKKEITLIINW